MTRKDVEYLELDGSAPFSRWFKRLDAVAAAKVTTALYRMEQGKLSNVKPVGQGVAEYRVDLGGYRIYFGQEGKVLIVLLGGGAKKGQSADIRMAQQCWRDYKARKKR